MHEESDNKLSAAEKREYERLLLVWGRLSLWQKLHVKARLALVRVYEVFQQLKIGRRG